MLLNSVFGFVAQRFREFDHEFDNELANRIIALHPHPFDDLFERRSHYCFVVIDNIVLSVQMIEIEFKADQRLFQTQGFHVV